MAFKGTGNEAGSTELNFIGKGTSVTGEITTESSLRIDGKVNGKVICKNTLTVGETGEIEGEIQANNAIIGGKIKGKLFIKQKLVLEARSSMIGELKASKLIIDEGAVFQGTSDMGLGDKVAPMKSVTDKENGPK
jgi:cytoskeletal protein CcmA (bactofilin family)